jgi:hypothetical protein
MLAQATKKSLSVKDIPGRMLTVGISRLRSEAEQIGCMPVCATRSLEIVSQDTKDERQRSL